MVDAHPAFIPGISASARLLRGFAVDFLTAHNPAATQWVMDPAYCLSISGVVLDGRDNVYLPATVAQLEQFPGLCVTVHDVIIGPDAVAMRFTEHGVTIRQPGCAAAWGGITLFQIENGRLRRGWAEEDYFARKRQLKTGICDNILAPHQAPWDVADALPQPATEAITRAWLNVPGAIVDPAQIDAICMEGPSFSALIAPDELRINQLFSAGNRVAFHADGHGRYMGGFDDIDPRLIGQKVVLPFAGMMTVQDGLVTHVQISADRLGLYRHLLGLNAAELEIS